MPSPSENTSTRRGLLGELARSAARAAKEVRSPDLSAVLADDAPPGGSVTETATRDSRAPARVPARCCSIAELIALAHEEGLTSRDDALRTLARQSWRLTPVDSDHPSAWLVTAEARLSGSTDAFLAQINLAATSRLAWRLPSTGWLALVVEPSASADDLGARGARGFVVPSPAAMPHGAVAAVLSPELVVPRVWNEAVQALELDEAEHEAYTRLRNRLQDVQGVEHDDAGGVGIAYHRLLGYPDETAGGMPQACAERCSDRRAPTEKQPAAGRRQPASWRLLMQVSIGSSRRAYVWAEAEDLRSGQLNELVAFVR
jgi:hypothetical protein